MKRTDRSGFETSRRLYPLPEVAHLLGVARTTVYGLIGRGEIELVKLGRRSLVTAESVDALVQRLRQGAARGDHR